MVRPDTFDVTGDRQAWPDYWLDRTLPPVDERTVDLVIATYNRCPSPQPRMNPLAWLLDSVRDQREARLGRVLVVDDGSTDQTRAVLAGYQKAFADKLRVLGTGRRMGSSRARNLGLAHSTADLVAIVDDDCQLTRHAIYGLHRSFGLQQRRDPACAAVHLAFYQRAVRPDRLAALRDIGCVDLERGRYQTQLKAFPREYVRRPRCSIARVPRSGNAAFLCTDREKRSAGRTTRATTYRESRRLSLWPPWTR